MMTLLEFCERYRISHKKAKCMAKEGAINVIETASLDLERIRQTLIVYNPLSALDLCYLLENPSALLSLGKFSGKASDQLEAIGDALHERAPLEIAATVSDAARGDDASVQALADWILSVLPVEPVGHAWIACRLLLALPETIREFEAPRISRALSRCRKLENFAGAWCYATRSGRKVTQYMRPKNSLASLDL